MILLRDGSVLSGGDPSGVGGPTEHERYYPWYYDLARPSITNAPQTINYGATFTIDSPDAASLGEVVLVPLPMDSTWRNEASSVKSPELRRVALTPTLHPMVSLRHLVGIYSLYSPRVECRPRAVGFALPRSSELAT